MNRNTKLKLGAAIAALTCTSAPAWAESFNVSAGDLKSALDAYARQAGVTLAYSEDAIKGVRTKGAVGDLTPQAALTKILTGTGFAPRLHDGAVGIVKDTMKSSEAIELPPMQLAQAVPAPRAAVETVTVTSSKLGGADVQSIPIAITALSQEQLTSRQVAGGPDLVKEIPNLTFTKTNFTGYSIQIRGIGTQAISVTTDPAVAVALNDIPFIRNHFFEQEFYDLSQAEVLRGPQGTLYGRNATAGVVNLVTAKPTDQFEAMASADIGNYKNRRFEGMINLPLVDDRFDLRIAGEWTKRSGYTTNTLTGNQVDGRNLWSSRVSVAWKPLERLKATLVWEHFQENDDRMRTAKQLCHTDPGPSSVDGIPVYPPGVVAKSGLGAAFTTTSAFFSQGCLPASLYSPESFQVPNGYALPMVTAGWVSGGIRLVNPYANATQSTNLRNIETTIDPRYTSKNNTVELNVDYNVTPALTFTSQTGFNQDFLWSTEDYNRFNTAENLFIDQGTSNSRDDTLVVPNGNYVCYDGTISFGGNNCAIGAGTPTGDFCDPQLGCSSRLVAQDISVEHAWQASQEFRLASNFSGPFNFSIGGNYLHYETEENYYVFSNMLTMFAATSGPHPDPWVPGVTTNFDCFKATNIYTNVGRDYSLDSGVPTESCYYIDPNPLESVNDLGHNYFLSQNPYTLNSYAGFGEAYYNVLPELKLTGGLRWTDDKKHFVSIPSELFTASYGYFSSGDVDQRWAKFTGRFAANWTPKLDFTDQTLLYGSFSHGYKAGGANPPGAVLTNYYGDAGNGVPIHPATFDPEYVDAYELGTKNTLLDGALTLNGNMFFYNYTGYQISEIVDRTSINLNFNATVKGAEVEATYEPLPGLKFNFAGGYEKTRIKNGQSAIDLMDRTAGHSDWMLMKPFPTQASNCIFPDYVVAALVLAGQQGAQGTPYTSACGLAYNAGYDPALGQSTYYYNDGAPYAVHSSSCGSCYSGPYPVTIGPSASQYAGYTLTYPGFDPRAGTSGDPYQGQNTYNGHDYGPAPNNGEGFAKDLGGNELPNAPHFTVSASVDYTIPVTSDWASTFHVDYYWQDYSWARVFNDNPYDRLRGYTNVNLALILTSQNGWQVMGYLKNIFNVTDVTGAFLNSDDSGLTTNIFLTDPRLFGLRVTKNW